MKPLLFIIFSFTILACSQQSPTKTIAPYNFKYSAYYWHLNPNTDSFQFYLAHYIDIDKSGNYKLMRHDSFMDHAKYYQGVLTDNISKLIDTSFINETFKADYSWNKDDGFIYDGFTYCYDITKEKNQLDRKIIFIPDKSPSQIKTLATLLDTLIYTQTSNQIDSFNLADYSDQLRKYHISVFGQLPEVKKEKPKFKPIKIER